MRDPRLFPAIIVALFFVAAARWALAGSWVQALYWFSGAMVNLAALCMGDR